MNGQIEQRIVDSQAKQLIGKKPYFESERQTMSKNTTISAALPGTFYRRPNPGDPPFVEEGEEITEEDVVGLIEVMKNFQEVKSNRSGTVKQFLVDNEEHVDEGQALLELESE
jgi:acetyl-CoA carboxylase biotin carboxyl carrier protein